VEAGDFDGPETRALLESFVRPLLERGADTLVLGCTHYPVLTPLIRHIAGPNVTIVDTGPAVARQAARVAPCLDVPLDGERGSMENTVRLVGYTTGNVALFARRARIILDAGGVPKTASAWHGLQWREGKLANGTQAT
jgi:glutamate racemase